MSYEHPVTRLNANGKLVLFCGLVFIGFGIAVQHWIALLWGETLVVVLSLGYLFSFRRTLLLRRGVLEFTLRPVRARAGGYVAGESIEIELEARNRGAFRLSQATLVPKLSSTVNGPANPLVLRIPRLSSCHAKFAIRPTLAGSWHVFGMRVKILDLMNLFEVETYLPATLELRVQPKAVPRPTRPIPVTLKNLEEKKGGHLLPVVGLGSDLRELRDFTPGTPFKQIDWKASARMRKLIAREYESELTVSTHFLLDIGPTMRWGSVGRRKLDYVQAITLSLLRLMSSNQDQVGLCFFDSQLFSYYPAQSGSRHFARLIEALLELNNVAHEDLTEGTRAELVARIGDFLFWQERIDLRLGGDGFEAVTRTFDDGLGLFESERVIEHVQQVLEHEKSLRAKRLYGKTRIASDPIDAELRLFCQIKGIELPLRFDTARDQKNRGLHEALERIYLRARTPQLIVILTDAHGLEITDQLRRTTQLLRKRHHHLALLLPFDPHFESRSRVDDATEQHLASLHRIEERQRGQVLRQELGRLGISLIHCTPDQALQTILDKLKRFRQAV